MKYLFDEWERVTVPLKHSAVFLFLDYDGTLTPIKSRPELANLSDANRKILKRISCADNIKIAIVSGRPLIEIKNQIRIDSFFYVGNHGFEIESNKFHHIHPAGVEMKNLMHCLSQELKTKLEGIQGILIEDKVYTLSIHYRQVKPEQVKEAKEILVRQVSDFLYHSQLALSEGKKVWEIKPAIHWNKGTTVLWLLAQNRIKASEPACVPVYLGDDRTDEDAFKVLKDKGITIKVTRHPEDPSFADYYINTPTEVYRFLKALYQLKTEKVNS